MHMKKMTHIGINLPFDWNQVDAFVRQPDGSLFSWFERFRCFHHLTYGIRNQTKSTLNLPFGDKELKWPVNQSLLHQMKQEGIVKEVFPLHEERKRKKLLNEWALNWSDFTWQPVDMIYLYFGTKIATYFGFLGMYTRWLFFPATFGFISHFFDFGSFQYLVLPVFFLFIISWSVLFFQFWKRKNLAFLERWRGEYTMTSFSGYEEMENVREVEAKLAADNHAARKTLFNQHEEWFQLILKIRNNAIVVLAILFLQLPFELAYTHLYETSTSDIIKYGLTAIYLLAIQYYTKIGGKMSVMLIETENSRCRETIADSLVYKVLGNLLENFIPYVTYNFKKFKSVRKKRRAKGLVHSFVLPTPRLQKQFLKPSYSASIGAEIEDGLFDDFLELALQFGTVMMFACAFPLVFCFAVLNNIMEIRSDALKLLIMFRRPVPRDAASIGAWWNIFQILIVISICTNCTLLICLYGREGNWRLEPGLAAILVMEHILLLIKFGFSHFVPEEPARVRAKREQNLVKAQELCYKQLLESISSLKDKKSL